MSIPSEDCLEEKKDHIDILIDFGERSEDRSKQFIEIKSGLKKKK